MISTMISTSTRGTSARRRLIAIALALTTAVGLTVAAAGSAGGAAPQAALVDRTGLVNPFIGTENFGNTFPGASAPFGMVQVSPDTGGQGGYDYHGTSIHGFSQTHLSGVGCGVVGELPIMPTTGAVTTGDYATYASPFSHADETSTPGYYRVGLAKYGINAEMTATDRTGWQRYTFPTGTAHNVLFNTGQANMPVLDSDIRVIGDHTLEGKVHDGGFCAGHDQHTVYFTAEFDKPFSSYGTWAGSTLSSGARDAANGSGNKGAWVSFGSSAAQVTLKVGLSYTGLGGARANLRAETGSGYDFDATRAALKARWNKQLSSPPSPGAPTTDRWRTTPRSTIRCCTRTSPATSTVPTTASTTRSTGPPTTHRGRTSHSGTPTAPRTSCSNYLHRGWRGTTRSRSWRSAARAAGCPDGPLPTAKRTS